MLLPFDALSPDLADLGNPGVTVAENVVPRARSFGPFRGLTVYSGATTARVQGAFACKNISGTVFVFAGDATKLYQLNNSTLAWTDISRLAGGAYATAAVDFWEFAQFGNVVIAVNGTDAPQAITLGAANFAALAGSPPIAKHVAVIRDFVVLGNVNDGTARPNRVVWSGFGDTTLWTPSATTQSDVQDLYGREGGAIQKVIGGEYGVIVTENSAWRMDYVGPTEIFRFDEIEQSQGTPSPQSVISHRGLVYYSTDEGFQIFDGLQSRPMGAERIDRTYKNDLDDGFITRVQGAAHPTDNLLIWAYAGPNNTSGLPNRLLIYNWVVDKWAFTGVGDIVTEYLLPSLSVSQALDSYGAEFSFLVDDSPHRVDDSVFAGGVQNFAGFTSAHKLAFFNGDALEARLTTGERMLHDGYRSFVSAVRPLVDGGVPIVYIDTRDLPTTAVSPGAAIAMNTRTGLCNARSSARYHRFRLKIPAASTWSHAIGVDVEAKPEGRF